jgi:hypothetical protein
MASFESLSRLINSLSKAEKRYFSLFCDLQSGDKVYFKLYQLLELRKNSIEEINAEFAVQYPQAVCETARKHLYRMVLKSLRSFESNRSIENKLLNMIYNIKILFNKGLIDLCIKEIDKGKNLALINEKFSYFLIIARMELQYLTKLQFSGHSENELIAKQEKINEVLHQELWINRHSSLFEILSFRYVRHGAPRTNKENNLLNDLLLEEFRITSNKNFNSLESRKLHLHFQSTYFMMIGNHIESLKLFYQLNDLFHENPTLLPDSPLYYIYVVNGILTDLRYMQKYDEMNYFLDSLKAIKLKSENLNEFIDQLIFQHKIARLIDLGEFKTGALLIDQHKYLINNSAKSAPPNFNASLNLLIAINFFGLQDYRPALQYVNSVSNLPHKYISDHIYILARIIKLILHFELGDEEFLQYEMRSAERKLKADKKLYKVEKLTLTFIRKSLLTRHAKKVLLQYYEEISGLKNDPYEQQLLKWFDLIAWAEAKIKKQTFAEVISKRFKTEAYIG